MKYIFLIIIFVLFSCGRPSSTEEETNEVKIRKKQEVLSDDYKIVQGEYKGTLELLDNGNIFGASINLRVVHDVDPSTGLPLKPKLVGSVIIYESTHIQEAKVMASYGVTNGSFDYASNKLALDVSDKLTVRGFANDNIINGALHSLTKGEVGHLKMVRSK